MEIRYWGIQSPEAIDRFLERSLMRRLQGRNLAKDFAIVYEPSEAFSIRAKDDLRSIRSHEKFDRYCATYRVPCISTHRAGGMMWHGPGQACLAPIVHIARRKIDGDVYGAILEETCIRVARRFGLVAKRNHYRRGAQGVWIAGKKIAFFGASFRGGFIFHGAALNVSPDLYPFSLIDPCNLPGVCVTSIKDELGAAPTVREVGMAMAEEFAHMIHTATKK